MQGRYHVSVSDIQALARPVLRHRVIPNFYAESERITPDNLVERLLEAVPPPRSGM
jgi:MoxR-like ATPase